MIKKLRIKFILLSMSAFLLVLAVIITGINIVNFSAVVNEADTLLEILAENKGDFPAVPGGSGAPLPHGMSPEVPYESRYFWVTIDCGTGEVMQAQTNRIVSVDQDTAVEYAEAALNSQREQGFIDGFRFCVDTESDRSEPYIRVTFLDCGRRLDAFRHFLLASICISLLGYLVVFVLIAFFSKRIIRPLSESYEKQKRFITDAGHEIKTPLTIISADADVLELELGENEWLKDIQKQAKRLSSLTNDLVMLSKMDEPDSSMQMIEFPFSDIVSETASSFQALAQTQGKDFICDIQPMLTLRGNEKAISQLVAILLDNALKYSPAGGKVSLSAEKTGKTLRLTVYNTSAAEIRQDSLPLLFDRFYRTDPSRSTQTGGYGIGLSVAKAIVSAHGGRIQAATDDGRSLRISVSFNA